MVNILRVQNLSKNYQKLEAVKDISFAVEAGEIVGLLGPNGAGKTTIISMILGILQPDGGSIEIMSRTTDKNVDKVTGDVNFQQFTLRFHLI